jgi:hypothetical protein
MSFKENLQKKMEIDRLAATVKRSMGPVGSTKKIDKPAMRALLRMTPFQETHERDLEMYVRESTEGPPTILVLDNELPIYRTTIGDVCVRRSPTIKEMISIRNAVKILNDAAVVESKRDASLTTIHRLTISLLDLSYASADIDAIAEEATRALEGNVPKGVTEALSLLAELLHFSEAPKAFRVRDFMVTGRLETDTSGAQRFGPIVIYGDQENTLKLITAAIGSREKEGIERLQAVALGDAEPDKDGAAVFAHLATMARAAHYDPYRTVGD